MTLSAIFQANWITDSTGGGTIFGHATFQGGKGRASEYLANKFASIPGMGPVLSPGDRLVGSTALDVFPTGELAYSGSGWSLVRHLTGATATHGGSTTAFTSTAHGLANGTPVVVNGLTNTLGGGISNGSTYYVVNTATNTFGLAATSGGTALTLGGSSNDSGTVSIGEQYDKLPYALLQIASGATNILTLDATKYAAPLVAVDVLVVDLIGGGDLSLSIDGGTWTACGQTMTGSNNIIRFRVMTPGMTTSLRVRCANAAGTAVLGAPGGFRPWYIDHTTVTNGVIVNDYGVDGQALHGFITTSVAGDHAAILDSVTLGTGNPLGNTPNVTMMLHLNDANFPSTGSGTSWSTDSAAFKTRAGAVSPIVLIGCWEADPTFFDATVQATMRSTLAALADSNTYYLDLNGAYGAMGYSGNAAISAGGFLQDKIHLAPQGEADVGDRLFRALRKGPLSATIGGNVSAFTLGHSLLGGTDVFGGRGTSIGTGTASFVGGGVLGATGTRKVLGSAALAGGGALAATGRRVVVGSASFQGGGTFAATGRRSVVGSATLSAGGGAFTASGTRAVLGAAALAGGGVLAATGSRTVHGAAALAGGGVFTGVGEDIQLGSALLDGGGVLAAEGVREVIGAALLRGSSDQDEEAILWPEGDELGWPEGDPILWAAGVHVFTAEGVRVVVGEALLDGGGVFSAVAAGINTGTGVLDGGGTLAAAGTRVVLGVASMQCGGTFAATGTRRVLGSATLAGGGTFTAVGDEIETGVATLIGGGLLAASGTRVVVGQASFAGGGLFAAAGVRTVHGSGVLTGGGVFSAAAAGITTGTATMLGGGTFTAVGHARYTGTASLNGGGIFTATGTRRVVASASLAGGGTFVASGLRVVHGTASLLGGGQFYATAGAIVSGVAFFDGGGVFHARAIPPMVTFSVRAARDGWQCTASADGWHARPARDGWKVEAR